jgi:protocatechuate 4,5-dioxygenase alpha chain
MAEQRQIFGTYLFGAEAAQKGYALNNMCFTFNDKANRDEFKADPEPYCRKFGLTEEQIKAVLAKDVIGLLKAGGNIYYLAKLTGIYGLNMQDIGAIQTGMTVDQFKAKLVAAGK